MKILIIKKDGTQKRRSVKVGSPFSETMHQRASFDGVHWFRVFVNGGEIVNPEDSPTLIETGMSIVLAHEDIVDPLIYQKGGVYGRHKGIL